ncbi:MAG: damage-inducible protein DinB [Planctomycetota bacterium]|nr:damage-inducible protein DinB [Planctomycetota bacterium]
MRYSFLIDTYRTEIEKVLSLWSMFDDDDIHRRPHPADRRGRNLLEQMIHQSVSENMWFSKMLGISVTDNPLPKEETRLAFMRTYAENANKRLAVLGEKDNAWWEEVTEFFDVKRKRAWVMTRRIAHTAHHRGQQAAMVRMLDYELHSTYGPTADTGGLMQNKAPVIYPYASIENLLSEEAGDRRKKPLPGPGDKPPTERLEV